MTKASLSCHNTHTAQWEGLIGQAGTGWTLRASQPQSCQGEPSGFQPLSPCPARGKCKCEQASPLQTESRELWIARSRILKTNKTTFGNAERPISLLPF